MNKRLQFLALLLIILLCSCKQANEELMPSTDSFQATIGTKTFRTETVNKSYASSANPTQFTITANAPGGAEFIVLTINNFDRNNAKDTYTIGTTANSTAAGAYHNHTIGAEETAINGQIVISEQVTNKINGTFNFNTQANTQITNGTFSITLP